MNKRIQNNNRIIRFFKYIYLKLFTINDSPQRIAIGFGLGAFLGILPGTGPLAALILATLFKLNKAAALLGSILTNTWISLLALVLAIKIGAGIMGLNWQNVYMAWVDLLKDFHWRHLLNMLIVKQILPLIIGYLVISVCISLVVYGCTLVILLMIKKKNQPKSA